MLFSQVATILGLASLSQAVHLRFHYSNNCSGASVVCNNIARNVCCTGNGLSVYFDLNRSVEGRVYDNGGCTRLRGVRTSSGSNNFCLTQGNSIMTGALWRPPPSLRLAGLPEPEACPVSGEKCESWVRPDVLSLADGTEYKIEGLGEADLALAADGSISSAQDLPEEFKSLVVTTTE
ncbi:hypothetical protein PspLS_08226 [Pyricularia sp. CBS 133598]|nr:hypothetical protein PspLS_08226 [Pyricularia sp. CBS 133598]